MHFYKKSYEDYSNVEKPVLMRTSYKWSDDDEKLKMVPVINKNYNNYNIDSDSKSESDDKNKKPFQWGYQQISQSNPKTTINSKVVQAMQKLQALYSNNANNQEKSANKNLNFLIDLAMVSSDTKPILGKP